MTMVWRKVAHIALGCALLIGFQLYGIAGLVQNEPPRGSVFGVAYSERTLAPIPRTLVRLTLVSPPETPTQPEVRPTPAPQEPQEMRYRHQGWDRPYWYDWYECGYEFRLYSEGRTWEAITDEHGRFQLRGIPVGVYSVETSSKWSHSYQSDIVIREGERLDLSLAIQPPAPFLELIHPQAVYHPDEALRVGVRGFSEDDTLQLSLSRVRQKTKDALPSGLHALLDEIRYGWWRDDAVLEERLKRYNAYYESKWTGETPVRGRDPEGVFTQYVDLPKQRDGTYLLQAQVGQKRRVALIVVSSVGVVSKVSREATELWCTDLRTGQPVENVLVRVYRSQKARAADAAAPKEMRLVGEGRTNRDGLARLGKIEPHEDWSYRDILLAVHSPRTGDLVYWGHVRVAPWAWEWNGAPSSEPFSGVLYTDRPIYRPGHTVHLKGIARLGDMQNYRLLPPNTPVRIAVLNPRDELLYETRTTTNAMGAFHASFPTSPEAETGYYTIRADVGNYGTIQHSVPLSAYRKPTYRITLKPERKLYMPNETVRIPIQTEYYFGMPVPNTQLTYTIYRRERWRWYDYREYDPAPSEADEGDEEEYDHYDGYNDYGQVIQVGELTTDASGRATLTLSARDLLPTDEKGRMLFWEASSVSYEYTVEVHALSEGWEGAKATALFEVAPSVWEATLVPDREFGESGVAYRYRVRLTDRRTGAPIQATLQWQATLKILAGERTRVGLQYEGTVRTNEFGVGEFQFTPERGGDWEVSIAARDPDGNSLKTRHTLWLWDEAYFSWWAPYRPDAHALEVRLQKRVYEPGEAVEVAIRTPHRDAAFYITVEGDRVYHSQVVRAQGALTRVRLPVTREQIPNAYVSVCMVRNKELVRREVEYRVGKRQGVLQVQVQTDKPRYEPGEAMLVRLQTADQQGKPVPAEVSLAVVDEAIYAIREDRPAAVRSAFYHRRWNAVQTDFSAYWLALQGDKGAVETIRRDFPDTAYWQPMIRTDSRGQATVRLCLPDNITEWRLTAIAHTADTKIGYARAKVKAAKDLMARLRLPMWLVEGDRTEINAIVSNDTDQPREVAVELRTPDGVRTQTVRVPARNSTTLRWDYTPKSLGEQRFLLIARERGGHLRDAEERALLVKPLSLTETDSRAVLLNAERTLTLTLRPDALTERTTLTLRSFPSASAIAFDSLPYLLDYPYGCVEQTVSRFVPALMAKRASEQLGAPMDAETLRKLAEITEQSLQRLARMQLENGGWGWWDEDEAYLWTTAYAVWGLHKAQQAGMPVPEAMYRKGIDALRRLVVQRLARVPEHEGREQWLSLYDWTFPLLVLASVDPTPPDALRYELTGVLTNWVAFLTEPRPAANNLYRSRELQMYRLHVAAMLQRWRSLPNADAHLRALWRALERDALEDRSHIDWAPNRTDEEWYWISWASIETQATALLTLLEARPLATELFGSPQRYEQLVGKTATGLALGYRNGRWYSSRDTALAVEALLEYSLRYERDSYREGAYEVWLNGQRVRTIEARAQGSRRPALTLRLEGLPWRVGENTLVLRPVRGAPLVSMTFEQPRQLAFQDADAPAGPLQLRVYRVERPAEMTTPGERLRPLRSGDTVRTGDLLRIDVVARMPRKVSRLDYTVLETPFPAGCAPFDTEAFLSAWWWDYIHEEIRDDRAAAFRSEWHRGSEYRYTLLVRAESPGEYTILPAHLWGMYAPYQAHSNPFRVRIAAR
jgi:hypothetical protein